MLILISPAKTLDFSPQAIVEQSSKPSLLPQSKQLIEILLKQSPRQLGKLMGISDKLAAQTHDYFSDWKAKYNAQSSKQALLAFRGDVYQGLAADDFDNASFEFAHQHLRILSGLYGVLRPLDLIQPYRLEMGSKVVGKHGKNLYAFWGDRIADAIGKALSEFDDPLLVNLASNEYFKAARANTLDCRVVTPAFKDFKNGQYKVLSFFAKKARGMMARHLIQKKITDVPGIRKFRAAGYRFNRELSTDDKPVFTRDEAPV